MTMGPRPPVMRLTAPIIRPLTDPTFLAKLATHADADGWHMVSLLIAEWNDGTNRFAARGERAYMACSPDGEPIDVGGLNIHPFASDATVGRIRRLYVVRAHRRKGVASALMQKLSTDAADHFKTLHLRTDSVEAATFYESIGFMRIVGDPQCTHARAVTARDFVR
jgi:GNAT superfamily N-acetyltransferase